MNQNIHTALIVLLIGMLTVFLVLCLVVLTGKVLILLVNKYGPVSNKSNISKQDFTSTLASTASGKSSIQKEKLAAIVSSVEIITQGKGRILNIEKVNPN